MDLIAGNRSWNTTKENEQLPQLQKQHINQKNYGSNDSDHNNNDDMSNHNNYANDDMYKYFLELYADLSSLTNDDKSRIVNSKH